MDLDPFRELDADKPWARLYMLRWVPPDVCASCGEPIESEADRARHYYHPRTGDRAHVRCPPISVVGPPSPV